MSNKIKYLLNFLCMTILLWSCSSKEYMDTSIQYSPVRLTSSEKETLKKALSVIYPGYDEKDKMLTKKINGYNINTDAQSGLFHEVRGSLYYAVALLDLGDKQFLKRAFDIIEKIISLQDTTKLSLTCGVWPYYEEEPLATKKSPVDYNWADFNAVSLLDVYLDHQAEIPQRLKPVIKNSIILAARSIQKRNVGPGYTNIAIMGTYVTYLTSHLFDLPDMKIYAKNRLDNFYSYTLNKGGFSEYNSPTYTIVAIDELERMKRHIIDPDAKTKIDSLYNMEWNIIARHYHKPSGQWAGPHSRSYFSLVRTSFYSLLTQASEGKIDLGLGNQAFYTKSKHKIPEYLLKYFHSPVYPRTEFDIFESDEPKVTGTTYLTDTYAFSSSNRSCLWNQRRPFLIYWGSKNKPLYLQLHFLHDQSDFSSAVFYSEQMKNHLLGAVNFVTNGGDKHINDRIKDAKFKAADLRLRFEFGNCTDTGKLNIPKVKNDRFTIILDSLCFSFQLYTSYFENFSGYWEKGGNGINSWIDYLIYKGPEKEIDLTKINQAILGFTFSIDSESDKLPFTIPSSKIWDKIMTVNWENMSLKIPVKPGLKPKNI